MSKINFKIKLRKLLVSFSQWIAPNEPPPPPQISDMHELLAYDLYREQKIRYLCFNNILCIVETL